MNNRITTYPFYKDPFLLQFLLDNYKTISRSKIASILGVNPAVISAASKLLNIKDFPAGSFYKKDINENYFESIDTKDKAYFLGLLYADGNIYLTKPKRGRVRGRMQIFLNQDDKYILEIFKSFLKFNDGKLYKDNNGYKLLVHNNKIVSDLQTKGITERKSLTLTFPNNQQVPQELLSHFIRGYFDGDGSIYIDPKFPNKGAISFTGSSFFINELKAHLEFLGFKVGKYYKRYKDVDVSAGSISLYISKTVFNKDIFSYLYKDCDNLFLTRKYKKFETMLNI